MNTPLVSERNSGLVFAWDHHPRRRRPLAGFLIGSVMLHALCFYLFQIIYPPAVALLPPPGRVTMIASNTEEGRVLLGWLEAEDPALASTTQPPADGRSLAMPVIQHAPSYLGRQPVLRDLPPLPPDPAIPSAQPPSPVSLSQTPRQILMKIEPTIVRWSTELESLGLRQNPEIKFTAAGHEPPQPAEFLIAVHKTGAVHYCFLEKSSGNTALDEQARKYLALCRFSAIHHSQAEIRDGLRWGTATLEWGNDIVAPALATESVAP